MDRLTQAEQNLIKSLKADLVRLQDRKERILTQAKGMDGMPRGYNVGDPTGSLAAAVADVDYEIQVGCAALSAALDMLTERIRQIAPTEAWDILHQRIIAGRSYRQIAETQSIGHEWVRQTIKRYCD